MTIKDSHIVGGIEVFECEKITFENCVATGVEGGGTLNPDRISWVNDMEAVILSDDGTCTHAKFTDPVQVAAFKAGLARNK